MGEKLCYRCNVVKPFSEFTKRKNLSPGKPAKPGTAAAYQANCKACRKAIDYERNIRRYGITVAEFDAMLAAQEMRCAICRTEVKPDTRLHIDHCHTSGKVRGLLCSPCNLFIGMAEDDSDILRRAAEYLDRE